ncbi:MAG: apolipoprotein N-acyltransferase [Bacteroidales bacterium]|nr:apolipoprotein N-acyltransferase [Bacteroidales bacterium]
MTRIQKIALALLSALLLSVPFFRWGTGFLLMVAFVPLLFIEDAIASQKAERQKLKAKKLKVKSQKSVKSKGGVMIGYALLAFVPFVLLTTWWIYFATWTGPVASVIVNGGYMTLTFLVFHHTRRRLGNRLGYASLVVFWLAFEFLYIRAQINFPWLVLGNGFANDVMLIQWYEWTGALGGSLWVMVMNILVFKLVKGWLSDRSFAANRKRIGWVVGVLMVPMLFSMVRFLTYQEKEDPYEMVVLQPNIDPYMKFQDMTQEEQTGYLLQLADSLVTPETDYIVGPETFINNGVWVSLMYKHPEILKLQVFLKRFPNAKLVLGATTFQVYKDSSQFTSSSRLYRGGPYQYDHFNSAFQLDASGEIPLYHKSMLVTGVEKMPHKELLGFLEDLVVNLGGAMRGNGTQEFRETFVSPQDSTRVGPVICWESVFGEYVTDYVSDAGANFIFIVTNDGWWRNTPGYRQHNSFARLRAIETRRSVARSANTGISSLIDQRGVELARIGWWERSGLRGTLNKNDKITFYVKHGDFLGRIAVLLTVILLLYSIVFRYIKK